MSASPDLLDRKSAARIWRFGECEFDELRYELRVWGEPVELERKPLEVLHQLLLRPGEAVRKEQLLDSVWDGLTVVEASLTTAVSKLRKALGEQDVIQTVPKIGYRIAVPVRFVMREPPSDLPALVEISKVAAARDIRAWTRRGLWWRWLVGGIAVLAAVSTWIAVSRRGTKSADPPTVAILPFQNVDENHGLDFLRSALPDEVANTLTSARSLTIRPLAAATRYVGPNVDLHRVGHDLDVNRIVTGHYLLTHDRIQITMEAVDPGENRILWRETVSVPANNLLELQELIGAMTRGKLATALGVKEFVPEATPRATNEEAYELYLKSTALDWDPAPNKDGIKLLRRAVLLDPSYAAAWGMLSLRYYRDARFGGGGPDMMAFSDAAAEKQLALSPDSPEPVAELTIHRTERGELVKAHRAALELVRRRPDNPNNHHVLNYVLRYGGSIEDAGRECELVVLLASKVVWGSCSTTFMELGDYNRAMDFVRKDLSSEWSKAHAIEVRLREGKKEQAIAIGAPQIPHWDSYKMLLACARGEPELHIKELASKVEVDDDPEVDYLFAGHLAYCGQAPAALRMLKTAIDRNYCSYPAMDKDPFFDQLRGRPDYLKIRAMGMKCHEAFVNNDERIPSEQAGTVRTPSAP
jgi:DNA-binding winged helix-turn-helix (wHTH) protein/TolB-like protein